MNNLEAFQAWGIDISFFYGSRDTMNTYFQGLHISEQLQEKQIKVYIVADASHQIWLDQPEETMKLLIEDFTESGIIEG